MVSNLLFGPSSFPGFLLLTEEIMVIIKDLCGGVWGCVGERGVGMCVCTHTLGTRH